MPHIRLTASANVEIADVSELLRELVAVLCTFDTIDAANVKAYHTCHENWAMGTLAPLGFVHCEVALLSGRPVELRRQIVDEIASVLRERFASEIASRQIGLTVELREMDKETYLK